jgi:hypothetical protein
LASLVLVLVLLLLVLHSQGTEVWVHLSHPWSDCPIAVGDAANIIGGAAATDDAGKAVLYLSRSQGLLVLHPDVLLSGGHHTRPCQVLPPTQLSSRVLIYCGILW